MDVELPETGAPSAASPRRTRRRARLWPILPLLIATTGIGPCSNQPLGHVTVSDATVDHVDDSGPRATDAPIGTATDVPAAPPDAPAVDLASGPPAVDATPIDMATADLSVPIDSAASDTGTRPQDAAADTGGGGLALGRTCQSVPACSAGQECLCCPLAALVAQCTCTVSCLHDSDCPASAPKCNVKTVYGIPIGRGLCTSPTFYCCWNC